MRLFLLQIVHAESPHKAVRFPGGGVLERDLTREITRTVTSALAQYLPGLTNQIVDSVLYAMERDGVGVLRTEAHVRTVVVSALKAALTAQSSSLNSIVSVRTLDGLEQVFRSLKDETTQFVK